MNNFLHENLFAIILFLLLIILLLIALIGVVLAKLLLTPKTDVSPIAAAHPAHKTDKVDVIVPIIEKSQRLKKMAEEVVVEKYFCGNHPDSPSVGTCLICEDVFCEKCLVEHDGLYFCKEHFKIFANNKWKQITDVKTTPDTPDDGLFIYHFKRQLWREKETPSFVLTHYKINIEEDYIESYIQLNVIENDADKLTLDIDRYRARL